MNISSFIYDWLKNIVVILILLSIFNMIMPSGNMKRYMEHITGLIIIFTIISPLLNIVNIDFNLEREVFNSITNNNSNQEEVLEVYNREVETLYYKKIEDRISELISENSGYKIINTEINIHKDGNKYGLIKEISIIIAESKGELENSKKIVVEKIGTHGSKKGKDVGVELASDLREKIAGELGINSELIYIYIKN